MDHSSHSRPVSPDLSGLTGLGPTDNESPLPSPRFGNFNSHHHFQQPAFGSRSHFGYQPTSVPQTSLHDQQFYQPDVMPPRRGMKTEDEDEYMPDATSSRRSLRVKQETTMESNGTYQDLPAPGMAIKPEDSDPTLGCKLTTSFPVARIKRIMQADEDIGKVAQVTPTVVSRALELFMIRLISASADQARGTGGAAASKGPRRVLAQHLKKAVTTNEKFDFLNEIVDKVPDAPAKAAKKEAGSDSEDTKPKRRGKKRKDSGDDV